MLLIHRSLTPRSLAPEIISTPSPKGPSVFLPPAEVLRQLRPAPPATAPPATLAPPVPAAPTPPPARDRIRIGGPEAERAKGPLVLRREDDLTATPRGSVRGDGTERVQATPPPAPIPSPPSFVADGGSMGGRLRLPPGLGRPETPSASGAPGTPSHPSTLGETLRELDRRLAQTGPRGTATGTGQQMGPLFFDPEGADFTLWLDRFRNEVYRNWIIPNAVLLGIRGHVDLEFTVERDGTVTGLKLVKSVGNPALDKAAANAILAGRFLPLPSDFAPPRVTMQVSFYYGEGPQG